ncbi:dolichyl pyrophosphate Man9GlcNAc2 alpha-1,3-glucosyltransferase [Nematostella vectensis]|uniref:dolichyl pyrophosphate Man9GlcNAc2 alpha-1,3-glucosyltransferase n=1 Tax=Nematostella vectensis TaxID=45351 RepID=UPI00207779AA|nr:dolichyl pyrophosphate Man9GlcNAc2 alpha-1,3-glucosyltransferase [Nematostella vectensis]
MAETFYAVLLCVFGAIVQRWSVSLGPYSGAGKKPMFGDYEAQRHWQEITYNLPINQWYFNSLDNNLLYWGLDYPPLTAYHSWLCGAIANNLNPEWVQLNVSRGYESSSHKLFMRYTVLLADVLIFIPAVMLFCLLCLSGRSSLQKVLIAAVILLYPGLTLIDHGHFQYNCISLGLCLIAITSLCMKHDVLGSIAFVLSLSYKQMELYHALPFFFYLLGRTLQIDTWSGRIIKLAQLGVAVIGTFVVCWIPFLTSIPNFVQVIHRLFPFSRGLFEDKVSNLWCALSVLVKLKNIFTQQHLIRISLWTTVIAVLPSSINLLRKPSEDKFLIALINSSLGFFLFSYQVHEKSILLVALPVCLLITFRPLVCTWFLLISTFSMWPLLEKDGQAMSYLPVMLLFYTVSHHVLHLAKFTGRIKGLFYFSMVGMVIIHVCAATIPSPSRYPDLYPVIISFYSAAHFGCFFLYFNYLQLTLPELGYPIVKHKQL